MRRRGERKEESERGRKGGARIGGFDTQSITIAAMFFVGGDFLTFYVLGDGGSGGRRDRTGRTDGPIKNKGLMLLMRRASPTWRGLLQPRTGQITSCSQHWRGRRSAG